jgi:hypothetical protein
MGEDKVLWTRLTKVQLLYELTRRTEDGTAVRDLAWSGLSRYQLGLLLEVLDRYALEPCDACGGEGGSVGPDDCPLCGRQQAGRYVG